MCPWLFPSSPCLLRTSVYLKSQNYKVTCYFIYFCQVFNALWKVSVFGVILVRIFPHSDWIRSDTEMRIRITPNTDTFCTMRPIAIYKIQRWFKVPYASKWLVLAALTWSISSCKTEILRLTLKKYLNPVITFRRRRIENVFFFSRNHFFSKRVKVILRESKQKKWKKRRKYPKRYSTRPDLRICFFDAHCFEFSYPLSSAQVLLDCAH